MASASAPPTPTPPIPPFLPSPSPTPAADGYHARLRPTGDICPDQAAVLILSAQITPSTPPPSHRPPSSAQLQGWITKENTVVMRKDYRLLSLPLLGRKEKPFHSLSSSFHAEGFAEENCRQPSCYCFFSLLFFPPPQIMRTQEQ